MQWRDRRRARRWWAEGEGGRAGAARATADSGRGLVGGAGGRGGLDEDCVEDGRIAARFGHRGGRGEHVCRVRRRHAGFGGGEPAIAASRGRALGREWQVGRGFEPSSLFCSAWLIG
jgi:hypothetical protein